MTDTITERHVEPDGLDFEERTAARMDPSETSICASWSHPPRTELFFIFARPGVMWQAGWSDMTRCAAYPMYRHGQLLS
jgi:hypothetical protein